MTPQPNTTQPRTASVGGFQRGTLSEHEHRRNDLRRSSNFVKRSSGLTVACLLRGGGQEHYSELVQLLSQATEQTLHSCGYSLEAASTNAPRALVSEALASCFAQFIEKHPAESMEGIMQALKDGLPTLVATVQYAVYDQHVENLLQPQLPEHLDRDADATVLLLADMSRVATAIRAFNFGLEPEATIAKATRFLQDVSLNMMDIISPQDTPAPNRMFHYQTLLNASARIFAASWDREASQWRGRFRKMSPEEKTACLDSLIENPMAAHGYLSSIEERTLSSMEGILEGACSAATPGMSFAELRQKTHSFAESLFQKGRAAALYAALLPPDTDVPLTTSSQPATAEHASPRRPQGASPHAEGNAMAPPLARSPSRSGDARQPSPAPSPAAAPARVSGNGLDPRSRSRDTFGLGARRRATPAASPDMAAGYVPPRRASAPPPPPPDAPPAVPRTVPPQASGNGMREARVGAFTTRSRSYGKDPEHVPVPAARPAPAPAGNYNAKPPRTFAANSTPQSRATVPSSSGLLASRGRGRIPPTP